MDYAQKNGNQKMIVTDQYNFMLIYFIPILVSGILDYFTQLLSRSIGRGKMMVEFFSAEMVLRV